MLRKVIGGTSTENGIVNISLCFSICETCKSQPLPAGSRRLKSRLEAAKHSKECPHSNVMLFSMVRLVRIDRAIDVGIDHLIGDVSTGRTENPLPQKCRPHTVCQSLEIPA